ncbi:unnamed protein product [[Candida] boidinii]|nr:unnamed protein product [[Candida] boidinii]
MEMVTLTIMTMRLEKIGKEEEEEEDVDDLYYPNNYSNNDSNNIDNSYNNSNPNASFNSQKSEPANKFKSLRNILLFNKTNENKDSAIETAIAMRSKIHTVNSSKSIKTGFYQNKRKSIHAELTSNKSSDEISNIKSNQDYDINDIFNNNNNINNNNINNNNHSNNNNYNNAYYNTEFRKFIPSHQKNNESISTLLDSSFNNDDQELLQNSSYNESFEIQDDDESLQNDGDLFLSNNSHNNLVDNIDPRSRSDSRADSITDSITDSISDSRSFEFGDETKDDNIATDTDNTLYKIVTPLNYNNNFRDLNNSSMTFDSHKNNLTRDLKINIYNFEKEKDRQFDNHSHSLSNTVDLNSLTRKPHTKGLRSPLAKSFHQGFHHQTAPQNYVANVVDEVPNSPVSKKSILSTSSSSSNPESAFSSSALPISSSPSSSASYIENSNHNNQRQTYKDQQQLQQQLQQRYRKLHSHQLSNSSVPEQIHREYHQMALFKQMSPSSARSVNTSHSHTSSQSSTTSSIDRIDSKFDSLNSKTDSLTNSIYTSNSISSSDNGNNTINNIPPPRLNQISRTSSNSSLNKHIRQSHSFSNSEFSPFDNPDPPFNNEIVFNTPPSTPSSLSSFSQPPINNNYAHHSHHKI